MVEWPSSRGAVGATQPDSFVRIHGATRPYLPICAQNNATLPANWDTRARADRGALHQGLGNLIDNAIKFRRWRRSLHVRATTEHVEIDVTDQGIGVRDDVELFAPFQRGGDEATIGIAGTGLGLYIVRNLVEAMGGTVNARPNHTKDRPSRSASPQRR